MEADYLEGIARLDDPTSVRLIITRDGIEVVEMVPGSRSIKIPAGSIDEISVADLDFEQRNTNSRWWRSALEPLRVSPASSNRANEERNYMLEVRYRAGDEVRNAVFRYSHRDGRTIALRLDQLLGKPVANDKHAEDHRTRG
ncbi:MAG TPA: hypothetical protein VLM38_21620 [Blastocatellia bacterium]|nr:hypothetical protein [Blastocatellia bacterium]